jgi:glycosyltransferase involved in cell wall biosynthesis
LRPVLIDITRLLGRRMKGRLPTGVDRVSLAYVRHFAQQAQAVVRLGKRSMVLPKAASAQLFDSLQNPAPGFHWAVLQSAGREFCNLWRGQISSGAFLFNTGHSGLENPAYPAQLRRLRVMPLFLLHDLIPITHPEYCRPGELDKHVLRMNNALNVGCGVIANSQATLNALASYAQKTGQLLPPAVAAPLAPAELPRPSPIRPLAGPYFVVLSTIEPRKNHWLLLQIWRKLIERMGERVPRLVVIGQRGWECENVIDLLERCESLRGIVTELPTCSDADLATYLHHAQALLFPSFAEGYGMPLVEAFSLRVPVIASDLSVFREIAGDIPEYLNPLDGLGWMARIEAYTNSNCTERVAQLNRLAHFVTPTWSAHFQTVEKLMERLS